MYYRSEEKEVNRYMGIGFLNLLTIIFIIGKLLGLFHFGWLIVFLPTIIDVAIIVICLLFVAIVSLIDALYEQRNN